MSLELLFGLVLQAAALGLLLFRVRRWRLGYAGVLFMFMSVAYHVLLVQCKTLSLQSSSKP